MIDEEGRKQTAISKSLKMSTRRIQQIYKQEIRRNVAKDFFHVGGHCQTNLTAKRPILNSGK